MNETIVCALEAISKHKDALEVIGKFIALFVGIIALIYLRKRAIANYRQSEAAFKQSEAAMKAAHDGRRSYDLDVFVKAVEQLGSESLAIRSGGIQALKQSYHKRDYFFGSQITATLNAFIKERTMQIEPKTSAPQFDVQLAINILGNRPENVSEPRIELRSVDLSGYKIDGNFEKADFQGAILDGAMMSGVNLKRADLRNCSLKKCELTQAKLDSADVEGANFEGADIMGAKFSVSGLKKEQLFAAKYWEKAEGPLVDYFKSQFDEENA